MDRTIAPGQAEEVKVSVPTTARRGKFEKTVRVETNDAQQAQLRLVCKGFVYEPLRLSPSLVNFGLVTASTPAITRKLRLTRGDGGPIAPVVETPKNPQLTVEVREVEKGERYELQVTFTPPWPKKYLRETLVVKTGVPESPEERIRVIGQLTPRLRSVPPRFGLSANLPAEQDFAVRLAWAPGQEDKVVNVSCTDPTVKVRYDAEPRPVITLTVPADYEPPGSTFVIVRTENDGNKPLRIPVVRAPHRARPKPPATTQPAP